jgi:hypothetical protein
MSPSLFNQSSVLRLAKASRRTGLARAASSLLLARTIKTVTKSEADGVAFVAKVVAPVSVVHADEAAHAKYKAYRINHQQAYSPNGACTKQAESFLARLRRMVEGQPHFVSPQHLHQYAAHAAWMEDHRRRANDALAKRIVSLAMAHPISRNWNGYWQPQAGS